MAARAQAVERFTIRTAADVEAARFALEHGGDHLHVVLLDVPAASNQLTGVRDYRELVTLAGVCGMRVRLMSDDPVRLELARIVGMEVADAQTYAQAHAPITATAFAGLASLSHTNAGPGLRRRRVGAAVGAETLQQHAHGADEVHQDYVTDDTDTDTAGAAAASAPDAATSTVDAMSSTAVRRADDPTRRIASTLAQPERFRPWQAAGDAAPGASRSTDVALSPDAADPSFAFLSSSSPFPARAVNPTASTTAEPVNGHTRQRRSWTKTAPVAATAAQLAAEQTAVRPPLQAEPRVASLTRRPTTERGTHRRSRWLGALVALVLCAALLGGGGYAAVITLPSASITVTPQQQPVEATLTYGVATDGATWDILIEPTTTGRTVTANASMPTTGTRIEPDQPASGTVLITNPLTWDVAISVGTTFVADDGQVFTATEETIVPAADPLGTLTFGSTTVSVVAAVGGSVGNVAPDSISGQLDAGVYYTNRTAFGGGTDRSVATVQQADIDALQATLRDDVQRQMPDATAGLIANAQHLPGSEQTSEVTYDIQPQAGTDAAEISGTASATVSVDIFSLDAAQEEARVVIQQRLQEAVTAEQRITPDSIQLGTPEAIDASGTAFRVRASGTAVAVLDAAMLETLREDLAGESVDVARARFMAQPGVAEVEIETHWSWLAGGLPQRTGQIELDITDNAASSATGTHDSTGQPGPATDDSAGPTRTPAGTPEGAGAGASPTTGP